MYTFYTFEYSESGLAYTNIVICTHVRHLFLNLRILKLGVDWFPLAD